MLYLLTQNKTFISVSMFNVALMMWIFRGLAGWELHLRPLGFFYWVEWVGITEINPLNLII